MERGDSLYGAKRLAMERSDSLWSEATLYMQQSGSLWNEATLYGAKRLSSWSEATLHKAKAPGYSRLPGYISSLYPGVRDKQPILTRIDYPGQDTIHRSDNLLKGKV